MTNTKPKFNIGDTVYEPWVNGHAMKKVPCPICFGKLSVNLILGNSEVQRIECNACNPGYSDPTGEMTVYSPEWGVKEVQIVGVEIDTHSREWYYSIYGRSHIREDNLHTEKELAVKIARDVLFPEVLKYAERNFAEQCAHHKKRLTWSAQYHRKEIGELRKKIVWHEARLAMKKSAEA